MEDSLSNSFYYFFSAVPQVLSGVLALFGVFVIFKIQSIKSELIGIAQIVEKINNYFKLKISEKTQDDEKNVKEVSHRVLMEQIEKSDLSAISKILNAMTEPIYFNYRDSYNKSYRILKLLSTATLGASVYTAIVIFIALLILPFGHFFLLHATLLYILFGVVLLAVGFSLLLFVKILMKSFNDLR